MAPHPETWLQVRPAGLFCVPGDFYIDPVQPVHRAVITHAHADHARAGHGVVLASRETLEIMRTRLGHGMAGSTQSLAYGEILPVGAGAKIWLRPAGHVLGSAQIAMEFGGSRAVVSGDFKRAADPTCAPFEPINCDVFVTEATFGLPVFTHPPAASEIAKLVQNVALFPGRTHLVGAYSLGKCQRVIGELRRAGWDRPVFLHTAQASVCDAYARLGVDLGDCRPIPADGAKMLGGIVLAPPSALADRWSRRLIEPLTCLASGWMRLKQRARAAAVELPLIISDHADWPELLATMRDVGAPEIWVTHGAEEALIYAATGLGLHARALRLVGYGDELAA